MPRKRKTRKPAHTSGKGNALVAAYNTGPDTYAAAVRDVLMAGDFGPEAVKSVLRKLDTDSAAEALEEAYGLAGVKTYGAQKPDGEVVTLRTDVFAFTVSGPADDILRASQERSAEIAAMFRKVGVFKSDSNVVVFRPIGLRDLATITPQDVFRMGSDMVAFCQDQTHQIRFVPNDFEMASSEDVARVIIGVYYREWTEEDSDICSEHFWDRADSDERLEAFAREAAAVFGPGCEVGDLSPIEDVFGEALEAALDVLEGQTDPSFFGSFPTASLSGGVRTLTFRNEEGVRLCLDIPEMIGVMGDLNLLEWTTGNPTFFGDEGDEADGMWADAFDDGDDFLDEGDEADARIPGDDAGFPEDPMNVVAFPPKRL